MLVRIRHRHHTMHIAFAAPADPLLKRTWSLGRPKVHIIERMLLCEPHLLLFAKGKADSRSPAIIYDAMQS